jgi:hypothetical protein
MDTECSKSLSPPTNTSISHFPSPDAARETLDDYNRRMSSILITAEAGSKILYNDPAGEEERLGSLGSYIAFELLGADDVDQMEHGRSLSDVPCDVTQSLNALSPD